MEKISMEVKGVGVEVVEDYCKSAFHEAYGRLLSVRDCLVIRRGKESVCSQIICLGCGVSFTKWDEGKSPNLGREKVYQDVKEFNFVSRSMEKRQKKHLCVLCGLGGVGKIEGMWFCEGHIESAKQKLG